MSDQSNAKTAVSAAIGRDPYTTTIRAGGHTLFADEPGSQGGADAGPNPYDLLAASLAACTLITLRMYADRKEWPMEAARLEITHSRIHAEDCQDCESEDGRVHVFELTLEASGDLSDEQRSRLLEIAQKCPVHQTLTSEIKIRTKLSNGGAAP